jgi:hypothetical protein
MRSQINRVGTCSVLGVSQVRIAAVTTEIWAALRDTASFARHGHLRAESLANRSRRNRRLPQAASMRRAYQTRLGMLLARCRHLCKAHVPQPVGIGG